ncbi:MAG: FAD-dependent oxidoreductase, partial [Pseudomonadota bacterium]
AIGPEYIVGVRMTFDEFWERGFSAQDGRAIARILADTGDVDFINVIRGRIESEAALISQFPTHGMQRAPDLDFAGSVREEFGLPTFHATGINDVATARHAIVEGKLDMVGMVRAHIADPHIVRKITEKREHEIRPCVGATYCLDRIYENGEALCIHNAATGREATMPHVVEPTRDDKKHIVVIGAGPAGLEAALTAAQRGHRVTLLEASDRVGGQLQLIARTARRAELLEIARWRAERCEALGVEIKFNCFAEADDVTALDPDVVIVATGGLPDTDILDNGNEHVVSTWDVLAGDHAIKGDVLLYDDNGTHPGMQAAECIASAGAALEFVTPERMLAPDVGGINQVAYTAAFHQHGVAVSLNHHVRSVSKVGERFEVELVSDYVDVVQKRVVDAVVVEHGTVPNDELYFALKSGSTNLGEVDYDALIAGRPQTISNNPGGRYALYRIGDAVASRNIHASIYDALRLVKDI